MPNKVTLQPGLDPGVVCEALRDKTLEEKPTHCHTSESSKNHRSQHVCLIGWGQDEVPKNRDSKAQDHHTGKYDELKGPVLLVAGDLLQY